MTNYNLPNQKKAENAGMELANKHLKKVEKALRCPECNDTGYIGDQGAGVKLNTEIEPCACEKGKQIAGEIGKKVSDLTVPEFKILMVECFEMLKQREIDTGMKEYNRLSRAKSNEMFIRDGKPIPKEW